MKLIDLTHTFTADMPVYPGDPKATLEQVASVEKDTYSDHKLTSVMHVGTHMDGPMHMIVGGKRLDEMPIEKFFGPGMLIDGRDQQVISADVLKNVSLPKGSVVLLYTGFGSKYRTDAYFKNFPKIAAEFAKEMVERNVHMLGMDMLSPDEDAPWPIHKILLGNDILILENLTHLDQLLGIKHFDIIALPFKLAANAAPVRVIARIP